MKTWQMIKLGLILAVYTTVACVGLAFVYNSTSKTIAARQAQICRVHCEMSSRARPGSPRQTKLCRPAVL